MFHLYTELLPTHTFHKLTHPALEETLVYIQYLDAFAKPNPPILIMAVISALNPPTALTLLHTYVNAYRFHLIT